jgi:hypothetical protein
MGFYVCRSQRRQKNYETPPAPVYVARECRMHVWNPIGRANGLPRAEQLLYASKGTSFVTERATEKEFSPP